MSRFYIGVDDKARNIKGGYIGINGVARKIKKIYLGDENGVAKEVYSSGKKLSEYTVGSTVYLNENGTPVEYLIVHIGLPSSLYDSSCNGVWLLRKDARENNGCTWHTPNINNYGESAIHEYLNNYFLNLFDNKLKTIIKSVKIPYVNGTGKGGLINSGSNGLSTKIFLLGAYECGVTTSYSNYIPVDGACLSYFNGSTDSKRIAYLNGVATQWWCRSPDTESTTHAWYSTVSGSLGRVGTSYLANIRPALILPLDTLFDEKTNKFNG